MSLAMRDCSCSLTKPFIECHRSVVIELFASWISISAFHVACEYIGVEPIPHRSKVTPVSFFCLLLKIAPFRGREALNRSAAPRSSEFRNYFEIIARLWSSWRAEA